MVRNSSKTLVAIFAAMVVVLGLTGRCMAQATDSTRVDTPSQRWLPPPQSYPTQQDNQARLLSLLRDSLLRGDSVKPSNPSRLSDSDVQSLKEAMKQFEKYFPKGLTADSLDAIPPELISKALSNPELVKQAKELAEKYSKENQKKKSNGQDDKNEEPKSETKPTENAIPPSTQNTGKNQSPSRQSQQIPEDRPDKSTRESTPEVDPKGKGFVDLMNKLRSTQETYEQNQQQSNSEPGQPQSSSAKERSSRGVAQHPDFKGPFPTSDTPELPPSSLTEPAPTNPSQTNRKGSQERSTAQRPSGTSMPNANNGQSSSSRRNKDPKQPSNPSNSKPSNSVPPNPQRSEPNSSPRKTENALPTGSRENSLSNDTSSGNSLENELRKQFGDGRLENSQGKENKRSEPPSGFSPSNERRGQNSKPFSRDSFNSNDSKSGSQSNSSTDIRSELDRRGFGPTMQKIIEEAQRASQAERPKAMPSKQSGATASTSAKSGNEENRESKSDIATTTPTKQPSSGFSKPNEPIQGPPKADSPISKSMQKTGDYLSKLWTDATKNSTASPKPTNSRSSTPRNSSTAPFARPEIPSIPNPFSAQVLQGLLILAVACVVACVILKIRFHKEQERKEALAAQMAPRIDEIQTRDDVVRAFHALAKQRLQSAQAWWTCGYVAERFQETLPEHAQPIRTLSGLYEQARYYPSEHQLSDDQIQSAKLALKQCEV
ncbi:MAG: hypothetical protein NTY15_16750 [Planctomycetota bacterium]|nr:hypothetical protein [Planctomycetota bacterium]